MVAAMGGMHAAQVFVKVAEYRLQQLDAADEELYIATLELADAAVTSRDGLADYYVSPRQLKLSWEASSKLQSGDIQYVLMKLLNASSGPKPDEAGARRALANERGCTVQESTNGATLTFTTPVHGDHAQQALQTAHRRNRVVECQRPGGKGGGAAGAAAERTITLDTSQLRVEPVPPPFLAELLKKLQVARPQPGEATPRSYAAGLELLHNILQHYGAFQPVVDSILAQQDGGAASRIGAVLAASSAEASSGACLQAQCLSWRIAGAAAGIAAAFAEPSGSNIATLARAVRKEMSEFFEKNVKHAITAMLAPGGPGPHNPPLQRLRAMGIDPRSFHSPHATVQSVVLHPQFELRQLLAHVSYDTHSLIDFTRPGRPSDAQLLDCMASLRDDLLQLAADCTSYGIPTTEAEEALTGGGGAAEAEGLVWLGDDIYGQLFFQLTGPLLTHFEFTDEGTTRTMDGTSKGLFHLGGCRLLEKTTFGVTADKSSVRLELSLPDDRGRLTLEIHPRDETRWDASKAAAVEAVLRAIQYPPLHTQPIDGLRVAETGGALALVEAAGDVPSSGELAASYERACRLCNVMGQFMVPFLRPCRRRRMVIENVSLAQRGGSVVAMGGCTVQASTASELAALILAQLASRVYLRTDCPGTDDEIRNHFRQYGRVRRDDLCTSADGTRRWVQFDNLVSGEHARSDANNAQFMDAEAVAAALSAPQACRVVARRTRGGSAAAIEYLHADLDLTNIQLHDDPAAGKDYARFMGLRHGPVFFARLGARAFERAARLLRQLYATSLALALSASEAARQVQISQARLSTAVATLVGLRVHLGHAMPSVVRAPLLRSLQAGMAECARMQWHQPDASSELQRTNGVRLEAAANIIAFLLSPPAGGTDSAPEEMRVYIRESESLQSDSARARLGRMFDTIDSDNSGTIDEAEGRQFLEAQGVEPKLVAGLWADLLKHADSDGDGQLTRTEWIDGFLSYRKDEAPEKKLKGMLERTGSVLRRLNRIFDVIDTDHSGTLDENEVKTYLRQEGVPESFLEQFWKEMLSMADVNADGEISRTEWVRGASEVFTAAKRAGRAAFVTSFTDMTMLLKGATATRHMVAVLKRGRVQLDSSGVPIIEDVPASSLGDVDCDARVTLRNRVVQIELPLWRFSDSAKLRLTRLFDAIDVDGSGELDEHEWKDFLAEQKMDASRQDHNWRLLMEAIDDDKDGTVTKAEFVRGWLELFGWKRTSREVADVLRKTGIPDRTDGLVLLKSGTVTERLVKEGGSARAASDEPAPSGPSTLAQTLQMCASLLMINEDTGKERRHWPLDRAVLTSILSVTADALLL
jgi:Ca2+-binding EF-hand superfamily protein